MIEIPGYKVERILGRGGMGTVYLAHQQSLARPVAVKVLASALAADEDFVRRFLNEGRLVAQLIHSNIVVVHDIGSSGDCHYMSMEYLPGGSLRERLLSGGDTDQGPALIRSLASALGHAHRQGVVHRDVKPSNIMFRVDGTPVLTDFGIAKLSTAATLMTVTGASVGSPRYMSPEQARGQKVDTRSDLYALGAVFYEVLTGVAPYQGDDPFALALMHVNDPIPRLPSAQARYQPLIDRLMAKTREQRYDNAEAFIAALDRVEQGLPAEEQEEATRVMPTLSDGSRPPRSRTGNRPRRRWPLVAAGLAGVAALGGAALLLWGTLSGEHNLAADQPSIGTLTLELPRQEEGRLHGAAEPGERWSDSSPPEVESPPPDRRTLTVREELAVAADNAPPPPTVGQETVREELAVAVDSASPPSPAADGTDREERAVLSVSASPPSPVEEETVREERAAAPPGPETSRPALYRVAETGPDSESVQEEATVAAQLEALEDERRQVVDMEDALYRNLEEIALSRQTGLPGTAAANGDKEEVNEEQAAEITALKARFDEHLKAWRLMTGRQGHALGTLEALAALDPNHPFLDEGRRQIAGAYANLAASNLRRGRLERARLYITRGEQMVSLGRFKRLRRQLAAAERRAAAAQPSVERTTTVVQPPQPENDSGDDLRGWNSR